MKLSGRWTLSEPGGKIKVEAKLPGDNFEALLRAGKIPDPYWGENEEKAQWVAEKDWVFSREFDADKELLSAKAVFLELESLDTFGETRINGRLAGRTENMFRRHDFEVKKLLKAGRNKIEILIRSPVKRAAEEAKKSPWLTLKCGHHKIPFMNHIRKAQCHAGWDWGPSIVTSGVYGDIQLRPVNEGRIIHAYTAQKFAGDSCALTVTVEYDALSAGKRRMEVEFDGAIAEETVELKKGLNILTQTIKVKKPRLWWPSGHGEQHLYQLRVRCGEDSVSKRIGLRTIELVTEKDEIGESMFFRVNGVPVFCKGANWIPADAMTGKIGDDAYKRLLADAKAANMNMIRVWGGGQYEKDSFYDTCDELGLMVWHDLMFACMIYPTHEEFVENVRREVEHQVKRLRHHACLALWCGDNESTAAATWYSNDDSAVKETLLLNYDRLNRMLWETVDKASSMTTRFWPSSPCNGHVDSGAGWRDDTRGDYHHWFGFDTGKSIFNTYREPSPRFCSEYGFQSLPELKTVREFASPEQLNLTSPQLEAHQKCANGNVKRILEPMTMYFRMPSTFEHTIYVSQLLQALMLKVPTEYWRTRRPRCMGALYWQLNDNWPVASWASIDYHGNWKQAHYHARRFFAPFLICAIQMDGCDDVEVWVVNDTSEKLEAKASMRVMTFEGGPLVSKSFNAAIPAMSAKKLAGLKASKLTASPRESFAWLEASAQDKTGRVLHACNEHFFAAYKRCGLADAKIRVEQGKLKGGIQRLTLTTDKPAFFVTLETDTRGVFSDNSFTLPPGVKKAVEYESRDGSPIKDLRITHLKQSYM